MPQKEIVNMRRFNEMNDFAPIVMFVYNRPEHTLKTLEALSKNHLAKESMLFVYADAPKSNAPESDLKNIEAVEKIVKKTAWCKKTVFIKREKNFGLADNIVRGVTEVVDRYGKVIVLEDDIVTSPVFLQFMNDGLNLYESESQVMHISGYIVPTSEILPETFFIRQSHCWGWATWKRAWNLFNADTNMLMKSLSSEIQKFNAGSNYFSQLKANHEGTLKTWAVKWYASIFISQGLVLHPSRSLVNNIGLDGTGINSGVTKKYQSELDDRILKVTKIPLEESQTANRILLEFYRRNKTVKNHKNTKIQIKSLLKVGMWSIVKFIRRARVKIHRVLLSLPPDISIHRSVSIKVTAIVETRFGGSIRIGKKSELQDYVCVLSYGGDIVIGENCSINAHTVIYGHGGTIIGNNVLIAGHCMIIPNSHNYSEEGILIRKQGHTSKGIRIEDDVWIGHGCSILDGVTIGKGSVIAAGSVVNRSIPPFTIYGGVPAKFIKNRFNEKS